MSTHPTPSHHRASPRVRSFPSFIPGASRIARALAVLALVSVSSALGAVPGENVPVKGYLEITTYGASVVANTSWLDAAHATENTQALQAGLDYAYNHHLVAYLPLGTYLINNTLICASVGDNSTPTYESPHHAVIGQTNSSGARPTIKIAGNATAFNSGKVPMIRFQHDHQEGSNPPDGVYDNVSQNFYSMLRGVNFNTNGKAGAAGVQMDAAQCSTVENVKVTATGSYCGFYGLPSRAAGGINLEVDGGQYGIYHADDGTPPLNTNSAAGIVVAGAILTNQTTSAIHYKGFAPLTVVGFEIVATGAHPAIVIPDGFSTNEATLVLIDGKITHDTSTQIAITNTAEDPGRNLYVRQVWISGTNKLVQSGSQAVVTSTGSASAWKKLAEYSNCHDTGLTGPDDFNSYNLINGATNQNQLSSIVTGSSPPADIVARHVPLIPTVNDSGVYIPLTSELATDGTTNVVTQLQNLINAHPKLYIPPGLYKVGSPGITLATDTVLFGAARHLTRFETHSSWLPTSSNKGILFKTADDTTNAATTFLGDLSLGVDMFNLTNAWFTALEWRAGGGSAVHIGEIYYSAQPWPFDPAGNPIDIVRIAGNGGGRWYFLGHTERGRNDHASFRQLRVQNTVGRPLWIYGLNLEHSRGSSFAEFQNAKNARVCGMKTEYTFEAPGEPQPWETNPLLTISTGSTNIGVFGAGAIRGGPGTGNGCIQIKDTGTNNILVACIVPQKLDSAYAGKLGDTLHDFLGGGSAIDYPRTVVTYKRGTIDDSLMTHANPDY